MAGLEGDGLNLLAELSLGGLAELGAVANRLTSVQNAQSNAAANIAATRSRIEDADYASEVSAMTRAQILQQSSMQVLVKANMTPEVVLSLLKQ